jgi:hypothetical protein
VHTRSGAFPRVAVIPARRKTFWSHAPGRRPRGHRRSTPMLGQHARDCNDRRDRRRAAAAAGNMFWVLRTTGNPMNLAAALATVVRQIDPEIAASQIRPLETYLSEAVAPRRFSLSLMAAFGIAALALALARGAPPGRHARRCIGHRSCHIRPSRGRCRDMATVACAVPTVRLGRLVVGVLRTE